MCCRLCDLTCKNGSHRLQEHDFYFTFKIEYLVQTNIRLNDVKDSHHHHLFSWLTPLWNCIQVTSEEFHDLSSLVSNWNIQQIRWISFSEVPHGSAWFLCHTRSVCCMKSEEIQRRTDNATRHSRKISTVLTEIQYNLLFKNDCSTLHTVLRTEGQIWDCASKSGC